jgi:hypothetical protein
VADVPPLLPASVFGLPPTKRSPPESPPQLTAIIGNMRKDTQQMVETIECRFMSF